jgi:DNA ligase D-like protein (predicted ligase)
MAQARAPERAGDWRARLEPGERELIAQRPPPKGSEAMKATLTRERFSDPAWIFERKLDGIRCIAVRRPDGVRLLSRNDLSLNGRFPEVATAHEDQDSSRFAADGEVVAFDGSATSFARLAERGRRYVPVFFYVFDLLWLDGYDVRGLPLRSRKRLLKGALSFHDPIRWTTHRNGEGEAMYEEACRKRWEGVIAKRADSAYGAARSRDWLKFKCEQGQEFVVGGFTAPKGSRTELGALLVGYYRDGELCYAGKVGTGFDRDTLRDLGGRLRGLARAEPPFADAREIRERGVSWVRPELVAQVSFSEWTEYGRLRHPRFLGLREDKKASEVVREG